MNMAIHYLTFLTQDTMQEKWNFLILKTFLLQ